MAETLSRDFLYASKLILHLFSINNLVKREYNLTGIIKDRAEYFAMEKRLKKAGILLDSTEFEPLQLLRLFCITFYLEV